MTSMLPLLLAWAPLCLLAALLLSGRFVGEERILRRVRRHAGRPARRRPQGAAGPDAARDRALAPRVHVVVRSRAAARDRTHVLT